MLDVLLSLILLTVLALYFWTGVAFLRVWRIDFALKIALILGVAISSVILVDSELSRNPTKDFEWLWRLLAAVLFVSAFGFAVSISLWVLWVFRSDREKTRFYWPRWLYVAATTTSLIVSLIGFIISSEWLAANGLAGSLIAPVALWMLAEPVGGYRAAGRAALSAIEDDCQLRTQIEQHRVLRMSRRLLRRMG